MTTNNIKMNRESNIDNIDPVHMKELRRTNCSNRGKANKLLRVEDISPNQTTSLFYCIYIVYILYIYIYCLYSSGWESKDLIHQNRMLK